MSHTQRALGGGGGGGGGRVGGAVGQVHVQTLPATRTSSWRSSNMLGNMAR